MGVSESKNEAPPRSDPSVSPASDARAADAEETVRRDPPRVDPTHSRETSLTDAKREKRRRAVRAFYAKAWKGARGFGTVVRDFLWAVAGPAIGALCAPIAVHYFRMVASPPATPANPNPAPKTSDITLFAVFGICVLIGVLITAGRQMWTTRRVEKVNKSRSQSLTRFTDELGSILDVLVEYSKTTGNAEHRQRLLKDTLREGRRLYAFEGVRLCLYLLQPNLDYEARKDAQNATRKEGPPPSLTTKPQEDPGKRDAIGQDAEAPPTPHPTGEAAEATQECPEVLNVTSDEAETLREVLVLEEHTGRRDIPRYQFTSGENARTLVEIATGNYSVVVVNPLNPPLHRRMDGHWEVMNVEYAENSGWRSFMAISVKGEKKSQGVLLIDTREEHEFTDEDKSIGWTIARLIAHGLEASNEKALDTRPETRRVIAALEAVRGGRRAESRGVESGRPRSTGVEPQRASGGSRPAPHRSHPDPSSGDRDVSN